MRYILTGAVGLSLLLGTAQVGWAARCGDDPGDNQKVIDARNDAESQCGPCASSTSHGAYVSCVAGVAKARVDASQLPTSCKGKVTRCAAKSTCGKSGFVTCCITKNAVTKCKLKKSASACTDKGGIANTTHSSCCSDTLPLTTDSCNASPSGAFLDAAGGLF